MWDNFQRVIRSKAENPFARGETQAGSWRIAAAAFICFLTAGLVLAYASLDAPFLWDDLHLIRVHTPQELVSVWSGTWDTDHLETPGFRPLTAYFNHFRALAFGESVAAQRIFLLALFAVYLTLAGLLARRLFQAGFWQIVLGGLLGLLHIRSVYHYLWISDGIHLLAGAFILGSILFLLRSLSSGRSIWLPACVSCAALALLTREDSLTVYPLLPYFGAATLRMERERGGIVTLPKRALGLFVAALLAVLGVYWYRRTASVPQAMPWELHPTALPWALAQIVQNAGDAQILTHPWPRYALVIGLWTTWLAALVLIGLFLFKRAAQIQILFWAGATLIASLPVLLTARANILLLPITFWGLLLAEALVELWRLAPTALWRVCAGAMMLFGLAAPAYGSFLLQQEQRLNNLVWMCANMDLIYGSAAHASIPESRRELWRNQLNAYGIYSAADYNTIWPKLVRQARDSGRFGVDPQGQLFIPRFDFLPFYPGRWGCVDYLR